MSTYNELHELAEKHGVTVDVPGGFRVTFKSQSIARFFWDMVQISEPNLGLCNYEYNCTMTVRYNTRLNHS